MSTRLKRRDFLGGALGLAGATLAWKSATRVFGAAASGYRATRHEPFAGIFPILQTPFRDDEQIDTPAFRRQVDFIIESGGHGLVWPQNGSEFQVLTDDERYALAEVLVQQAAGRRPVILGVQSTNFWRSALGFARHAERLGADGIIALPPYQISPTVPQALEFYRTLAAATSLPMFIQNSGGEQGPALPVDTMLELAREFPQVAYIKEEARPVQERITELATRGQGLIKGVFSGAGGTHLLDELAVGSRGSCPSTGMIDVFARVFDLWEAGKRDEAAALFAGLQPMFSFRAEGLHWLFKEKEIMRRRGLAPNARTRIAGDLVWPDAETRRRFDEAYAAIEPLFTWHA